MVEEGADEGKDHVKGALVFCFERAVYGVVNEEPVEGVNVVGRMEVNAKAGSGRLLLSGGQDGARVFEIGGADENERTLEMRGAGSGEEGF